MHSLPSAAAALSLAALGLSAGTAPAADAIDRHLWRSRLLVVIAPQPGDPRIREQRRLYEQAQAGARDRDLVLVRASGPGAEAQAARARFGVGQDDFAAILVGKDGEAKLTSAGPIAAERLFDEIDRMPMRRDEMRRQGAPR